MGKIIFIALCLLASFHSAFSQDENAIDIYTDTDCMMDIDAGVYDLGLWTTSNCNASHRAFDYKNTAEWGKYKVLRAVGWATFGIGAAGTLTGMFLAALAIDAAPSAGNAAKIVFWSGAGLTVASIPVLISAYHYRGKAKSMALNLGVSPLATPKTSNENPYTPALTLSFNF